MDNGNNVSFMKKHKDPIVEEVRRYRQARAAKFSYDIYAIGEDARKREATSGHKILQPPKRKAKPRSGK